MSGGFSGHLLSRHYNLANLRPMAPFGQPSTSLPDPGNLSIHGPMSFNPNMHGAPVFSPSTSLDASQMYNFTDAARETALKVEEMATKLNMKLGPEFISQRPGAAGGPKLTYAEGWKIINLANEVFGFNGWSSNIVSLTIDFIDTNENTNRVSVGASAIVKVTLRDGAFHEDTGYGLAENQKSKGQAIDKCKKEAVTDALKRTLRNFGNVLGNCLYDKSYAQEIVKIKVPPPKLDKDNLYRRPEHQEKKPTLSPTLESKPDIHASGTHQQANGIKKSTLSIHNGDLPGASTSGLSVKREQKSEVVPHVRSQQAPPAQIVQAQPVQNVNHPRNQTNKPPPRTNQGPRRPTIEVLAIAKREHEEKQRIQQEEKQQAVPPPPPNQTTSDNATHAVRSVTFADDDDPYGMNSDDDALWLACDLGEADTGRPIDYDDGGNRGNEPPACGDVSVVGPSTIQKSAAHDSPPPQMEDILTTHPHFPAQQNPTMQQQMGPPPPQLHPQPQSHRPRIFNPRMPGSASVGMGASTSPSIPATPGGQAAKSGAFVFPSGVADMAQNNPSRITLGSKRTADTMQRRPTQGPGMGLDNGTNRLQSGTHQMRQTSGGGEHPDAVEAKRTRY